MATHTNSGNRSSSLVEHSNSLRQQQLGLRHHCEDTQDVKGITYCITPTGKERRRKNSYYSLTYKFTECVEEAKERGKGRLRE